MFNVMGHTFELIEIRYVTSRCRRDRRLDAFRILTPTHSAILHEITH
jgi:hypothetical protein